MVVTLVIFVLGTPCGWNFLLSISFALHIIKIKLPNDKLPSTT